MSNISVQTLISWQNGDSNRSSWAILWSCTATIFACTWTVLHLGIPRRGMSEQRVLLRKVRFLLITALAPEIITAYAFGEFLAARKLVKDLLDNNLAPPSWGLTHAFYLAMGSVHLITTDEYEIPLCERTKSSDEWEYTACNKDIVTLVKLQKISIPPIEHRDIQDRSKADSLSKFITLIQSTWFVVNSTFRVAMHMTLSPLEISCLAYVFCTAITYVFWWNKPKDILTTQRIPIPLSSDQLPEDMLNRILNFDPAQRTETHFRWKKLNLPSTEAEMLTVIRGRMPALAGLLTGVIFCCIHITAWNFSFPSRIEQILWRCCSISSAVIPLFSLSMVAIRRLSPVAFDAAWSIILSVYCLIMMIYGTSRLILIGIMFATLRSLPASSYDSINWALKLPHIA